MRVTVRGLNHRLRGVVTVFGISLAIITAVAGVLAYSNKNAQAAVPPDSCFTMSGGTITAYSTASNCPKNVDIPSTIGGVTVTGIGTQAFVNKALTAVSIPNTVTSIGSMAFYLNQLTGMVIPSTVTSLGSSSFAYNSNLTFFTVQGDPATVGAGILTGNNSLTTVSYNGTTYTPANPNDDTCFTTSGGTITGFLKGDPANIKANGQACLGTELVIPSSIGGTTITSLGSSSLSSKGFTTVTIPSTITTISSFSLYNNQLTEVIVPASVTSIGDYALYNNQITQATFQGDPATVGANVLRNNPVQSLTYAGTTYTSANSPIDESCFEFNSATGVITGFTRADPATVKATGRACMGSSLVVPAEIGGVAVEAINNGAFNYPFVSATIPNSIQRVGSSNSGVFARYGQDAIQSPNSLLVPRTDQNTPSPIYDFQPHTVPFAGVDATIQATQLTGTPSGLGFSPSFSDMFIPRIGGEWRTGLTTTSIRLARDNSMMVEVMIEPGAYQTMSLYFTDAENTSMRVYGEDEDGNLLDVTDWVVETRDAYENISPANTPNPYTKNAADIEIAGSGAAQNEDMILITIDRETLASMRKIVTIFTGGSNQSSPTDFVQYGYYAERIPDPEQPTGPVDPEIPTSPDDVKAPNAGVGSLTHGFITITGMLLLTSIGVVTVLRRRSAV